MPGKDQNLLDGWNKSCLNSFFIDLSQIICVILPHYAAMLFEEKTLDTFNASLQRCQADPLFLTLFYQKFVISNAEARKKLAHTDMHNQKMILHASLYMIMLAVQNNKAANTYLEQIALRHSKSDLDVKPELYDYWLEALIPTVNEIDTEFNEEVEAAWRAVMTYGIEYMKSKYDTAPNKLIHS